MQSWISNSENALLYTASDNALHCLRCPTLRGLAMGDHTLVSYIVTIHSPALLLSDNWQFHFISFNAHL